MKPKQTLKQREKLKANGVRRRKTPPPSRPASDVHLNGLPSWDDVSSIADVLRGSASLHRMMLATDLAQPEPPPIRLCKDCAHHRPGEYRMLCKAPALAETDWATGNQTWPIEYAHINRNYEHLCGVEAIYFEPAPRSEPGSITRVEPGTPLLPPPSPSFLQRLREWFA